MKQDLWRRAEDLFHAALGRPPEARRAFLDEARVEEPEVGHLVELLLSKDEQAGSFLEEPVLGTLPGVRGTLAGRRLGPYRILSLLGAGGMGEVYRAHDGKLGRDVAIKILPPELAREPGRVARFRREARTLARLNHPNIAAIYGLEESADADYLVLELVDGETPRGPLPLPAALDYARQVAVALEAAHQHGVVHRDLKPANLKVTPEGTVKVLDFSLAKLVFRREGNPEQAQPAGASADESVTGQILGTPAYMSPEQARGAGVDPRADIWAFGCLLYELLAGTRAFQRGSVAATTAAVLQEEPDWKALPRNTPARVLDLLQRCLQKDPNRRLSHIGDARAALERVQLGRRRRGSPGKTAGSARTRLAPIRSLAVLPLSNLAGDPEQEPFADGMTEALIGELAQVRALRVISRTSAMHYRGTTKKMPEIGRELGVDGIVEGSVLRQGNRVRITAQLVHAATDQHLWARAYERDLQDLLQLQGEVARAIADEIQAEVTPLERARLSRIRPVNVESHEAYTRGRYHWGRVHPERSIEHFRRAIAIDPENALAYGGIADAQCMMLGAAMQLHPPGELAPAARSAALDALARDDSLAEPHVSLARVLFWYDRDPAGAERELRRATQLNPSCALAHFIAGLQFACLLRHDEAITEFQRTLQLDPVSCWFATIAGFFMYELGERDAGRQQMQKALDLDAEMSQLWSLQSVIHGYEGKLQEAIEEAREGVRLSAGLPISQAYLGYALGIAGRRDEALEVLDQLEGLSRQRYVAASTRALCWLGLADLERVFEWLETGYRQHDAYLPYLRAMRVFRPLSSDPRFAELLRRLGLTP